MNRFAMEFSKRLDPAEFDPAILPLQNKALDKLREARKSGVQEEIDNALDVALELDAMGLMAS